MLVLTFNQRSDFLLPVCLFDRAIKMEQDSSLRLLDIECFSFL